MTSTSARAKSGRWDVIVFGAGPAGSTLSTRLAARYRLLLLERVRSPTLERPAADWRIGESLPGAAAVLLRRLQLFDRFVVDGHAVRGASVSVWDVTTPSWVDALLDPNGPGWHLDRVRFDAMLFDAARNAGAVVAPLCGRFQVVRSSNEWHVYDEWSKQEYRAAVLVDATGSGSALCRSLGLRRHAQDRLVSVHAQLPALPQDVDRCTRICADRDGWWYSVRVPSGRRVLAFHLDADDLSLRSVRNADSFLLRARRLPLLAEVLPESLQNLKTRVVPAGSSTLDLRACAELPGLYAIGDAMLTFDPISSQGMFHAMASAEAAAEAIARNLGGDANADSDYFSEMLNVEARYRAQLAATYSRPLRYREGLFWKRRWGPSASIRDA